MATNEPGSNSGVKDDPFSAEITKDTKVEESNVESAEIKDESKERTGKKVITGTTEDNANNTIPPVPKLLGDAIKTANATQKVECPIRESPDLRSFSTPLSISSLTTSFLVSECKDSHVIQIQIDSNPPFSINAQRPECCIYRVPDTLRNIEQAAYTPQMVSIGPLHHGNEKLMPMEKYKERYLVEFCARTKKDPIELENQIKENEEKIRHCYEENLNELTSDTFVKMILLDSIFVIELFFRIYHSREEDNDELYSDPIIGKPCLWLLIFRDLILLENQLPYFIFKDLYNFAIPNATTGDPSFSFLTYTFLGRYVSLPKIERKKNLQCSWEEKPHRTEQQEKEPLGQPQEETPQQYFRMIESEEHKHFTDMVRTLRLANLTELENNDGDCVLLYNATKLYEAGVKFKASSQEWPLGVAFQRGVLTLPRLKIQGDTEQLLRNLMALEQLHYPDESYICSYIFLMDYLVDTENDADLLVKNGIFSHASSQKISKLLNSLSAGNLLAFDHHIDIAKGLNEHYKNWWNRSVTTLRLVYFRDIWRFSGTTAAIILLGLSVVQAVKAIKTWNKE